MTDDVDSNSAFTDGPDTETLVSGTEVGGTGFTVSTDERLRLAGGCSHPLRRQSSGPGADGPGYAREDDFDVGPQTPGRGGAYEGGDVVYSEIESVVSRLRAEYETEELGLKESMAAELRRQRVQKEKRLRERTERRVRQAEAEVQRAAGADSPSKAAVSEAGESTPDVETPRVEAISEVGDEVAAEEEQKTSVALPTPTVDALIGDTEPAKIPGSPDTEVLDTPRRADRPDSAAEAPAVVTRLPTIPALGVLMLRSGLNVRFAIHARVRSPEALLCCALVQHVAILLEQPSQAAALRRLAKRGEVRELVERARERERLNPSVPKNREGQAGLPLADSALRQLSIWGDHLSGDRHMAPTEWAVVMRSAGIAAVRQLKITTAVTGVTAALAFKSALGRAHGGRTPQEASLSSGPATSGSWSAPKPEPKQGARAAKRSNKVHPVASDALRFLSRVEDVLIMAAEVASKLREEFRAYDDDRDGVLSRADVEAALTSTGMAPDTTTVAAVLALGARPSGRRKHRVPEAASSGASASDRGSSPASGPGAPGTSAAAIFQNVVRVGASAQRFGGSSKRRRGKKTRGATTSCVSFYEFATLVLAEARTVDAALVGSKTASEIGADFDATTVDGSKNDGAATTKPSAVREAEAAFSTVDAVADGDESKTAPQPPKAAAQPSIERARETARSLFSPESRRLVLKHRGGGAAVPEAGRYRMFAALVAQFVFPLFFGIPQLWRQPFVVRFYFTFMFPLLVLCGGALTCNILGYGDTSIVAGWVPMVLYCVSLSTLGCYVVNPARTALPHEAIGTGGRLRWAVRRVLLRSVHTTGRRAQFVRMGLDLLVALVAGGFGNHEGAGRDSTLGHLVGYEVALVEVQRGKAGSIGVPLWGRSASSELGVKWTRRSAVLVGLSGLLLLVVLVGLRVVGAPEWFWPLQFVWPGTFTAAGSFGDMCIKVLPTALFSLAAVAWLLPSITAGLALASEFQSLSAAVAMFNRISAVREQAEVHVSASTRPSALAGSGLVTTELVRRRGQPYGERSDDVAVTLVVRSVDDLQTWWQFRDVLVRLAVAFARQAVPLCRSYVAVQVLATAALAARAFSDGNLVAFDAWTPLDDLWLDVLLVCAAFLGPVSLSTALYAWNAFNRAVSRPHTAWLLQRAQQPDAAPGMAMLAGAQAGLVGEVPLKWGASYLGFVQTSPMAPLRVMQVVGAAAVVFGVVRSVQVYS